MKHKMEGTLALLLVFCPLSSISAKKISVHSHTPLQHNQSVGDEESLPVPEDTFSRGNYYLDRGENQKAVDCYLEAERGQGGSTPWILFARSKAYIGLKNLEKGRDDIDAFLKGTDETDDMHHEWGKAWEKAGMFGEAQFHFARMVELLEPKPTEDALYHLGGIYDKLNRYSDGLKVFDRTLEIYPKYYNALHYRGFILEKVHRGEDALKDYNRMIELQPETPTGYTLRGILLEKMGRYKESLLDCDKLLELSPEKGEFYKGIRENLLKKLKGG